MSDEYKGHWISTSRVPQFDFLKPKEQDIHIEDIAHALSLSCRFGGHGRFFYSVAEHCVLVSLLCEMEEADDTTCLAALLHDAEEAYLPDIPSPIKACMPEAEKLYDAIKKAIIRKFQLSEANWELIDRLDKSICIQEAKALGIWNEHWIATEALKNSVPFGFWSAPKAEEVFLKVFGVLYKK